jgi:excisionase family DNA binding protein
VTSIPVPPEVIEALAQRTAEIVTERMGQQPETWIGVDQAAEHLACPKSRIYALVSAQRIPHEKDGSRLLFRRSDLDEWLQQGGGTRA